MPDVVAWTLAPIVVVTATLLGARLQVAGRHLGGLVLIMGTLIAVSEAMILHSTAAAPSKVSFGDAMLLLDALATAGAGAVLSAKLLSRRAAVRVARQPDLKSTGADRTPPITKPRTGRSVA
jgi:hypothetical protein